MTKQTYVIFGAVLILLIAGAVLVRQKREPAPITPPAPIIQPPVITPIPQQEPKQDYTTRTHPRLERKIIEGWNMYTNEEFGFEVQYPKEWFLYDLKKFNQDDKNKTCYPSGGSDINKNVILSKKDLGRCVTAGISSHVGDLEIGIFSSEYKETLNRGQMKGYRDEIIIIDGVEAVKFSQIEQFISSIPERKTVSININYKGKYYNIFFLKSDPVDDQILSTFRFLK